MTWTTSPCGVSGSLPITGLIKAPDPVFDVTVITGRSWICILFRGFADIILPFCMTRSYPSATASTYPWPVFTTIVSITPTGTWSAFIASKSSAGDTG